MSHHPERTEKNCLNCGTTVAGRFCQHCGQENVPGHMPFLALVTHFVYDIFHFDGKFFDTLKYLLIKPGFVPKQYVLGKRVSFLDPIRMYLFTSAAFFLLFFTFVRGNELITMSAMHPLSKAERFDQASRIYHSGAFQRDTGVQPLHALLDTNYEVILKKPNKYIPVDSVYPIQWKHGEASFAARKSEGDKPLIQSESDWVEKSLNERWQRYKQKFGGDTDAVVTDFADKLLHRFPYLLFISLPFFALILKLLYVRRHAFFYFDHAVFTLYHYIISFILLLFFFGLDGLGDKTGYDIFHTVAGLLVPLWMIYLLVSMKHFYGQGWGRTLSKFVLLNLFGLAAMGLLAILFIVVSIFQI